MGTYNPNGRNVTRPDENRPSWHAQDQDRSERTRSFDDDDRSWRGRDDDRFERARDLGDRGRWGSARDQRGHWEDDQRHQTERYGQGQSGYGAGRLGDDRAYQSRNQSWYGRDDRDQGLGTDDRFERGRGGADFGNERGMERGMDRGMDRGRGYSPERYSSQTGYGERPDFERGSPQSFRGGSMGAQYQQRGLHRGKGPQGYMRSDDRIKECVCEALTDDEHLDATHIEVVVKNGEVILTGTVEDRYAKRCAEDIAERQSGVRDVQNNLRIGDRDLRGNQSPGSTVSKNETETTGSGHASNDKKPRA